jgi:hypothetical protein
MTQLPTVVSELWKYSTALAQTAAAQPAQIPATVVATGSRSVRADTNTLSPAQLPASGFPARSPPAHPS